MELREVKTTPKTSKQQKSRRKKKRTALVVIFVLLILLLVVGALCFTVLFPIKNISVEGNSLYSGEEIISAARVNKGDKLFSVFSEPVNSKVTKTLPYVKSIKLEKHLPDTLKIKVTEAKETFAFSVGETVYISDEDYKILREASEIPENTVAVALPEKFEFISGDTLDSSNPSLSLLSEIYTSLTKEEMPVNSVEISDYGYITAKIFGRFTVCFGARENLDGKISHLKGMISEINNKNGTTSLGKIDLTSWSNEKREGYFELTAN